MRNTAKIRGKTTLNNHVKKAAINSGSLGYKKNENTATATASLIAILPNKILGERAIKP
jgi:hypothetical protein